jgi:hypothetical protein
MPKKNQSMSQSLRHEPKWPLEYEITELASNLLRYLGSSIDSGEQIHRALESVVALDLDFQ